MCKLTEISRVLVFFMFLNYIMTGFKKLMSDYGLGVIIILLLLAFAVSSFSDYVTTKGLGGDEGHSNLGLSAAAYADSQEMASGATPSSSADIGDFAPVNAGTTSGSSQPIQNPADLLPKDSNSEFGMGAPSGSAINNTGLLSAGHHIGVGGSDAPMRNANLQLRAEDANPRAYVGPWNQSTIEADGSKRGI